MNFVEKFKEGQRKENFGLPTGLAPLDEAIDGVQRKSIIGVASEAKIGKTTFVDQCFVLEPYSYMLKNPEIKIDWIYFSFEIDRIKKEYKYASYYFYKDYGVSYFKYEGEEYELSPRYLTGRLRDMKRKEFIPVSEEHKRMLEQIYVNRIIPLFGKFDKNGKRLSKGVIDFIEDRGHPTALKIYLMNYAKENGEFITEQYTLKNEYGQSVTKDRIIGYKPKDPKKYVIIITDHLRKLNREQKLTLKENIDLYIDYQVGLRNWCGFTFVDIIHLNRDISDINRIKYLAEYLYPTGSSVKDTGNLSEECDYLFTLFNPRDEKYKIDKHFGLDLKNYPKYRSIHLVESRDTECPIHFATNMYGHINLFTPIKK